jgi:hypothetical protein
MNRSPTWSGNDAREAVASARAAALQGKSLCRRKFLHGNSKRRNVRLKVERRCRESVRFEEGACHQVRKLIAPAPSHPLLTQHHVPLQ